MKYGTQEASCREQAIDDTLLQSEIGFWREMIESCEDTQPAETIERMRQAKALAEYKLERVLRARHAAGATGLERPSNIYRLPGTPKPEK